MKKKCTLGSADKLLLLAVLLLLAALTALFGSLIKSVHSQKKICQSVVSLGKYEYNASFLEQAEKLAGIRSITPVCEVSVTLKTDGYTMDTILTGVDTSELLMCIKDSQEVMLGNTPALLIGEKCLSSLTDANGQTVSEKKEKEILENYRELTWEYRLTGAGQEISGGAGSDRAVQDGEERNNGTQDGNAKQRGFRRVEAVYSRGNPVRTEKRHLYPIPSGSGTDGRLPKQSGGHEYIENPSDSTGRGKLQKGCRTV